MTRSRLHLPGPTRWCGRISIKLLTAEDVEGGLGQIAAHRADRLPVTLAQAQPQVELADMPVGTARVIDSHRVGGFGKRPLQVAVHVGPRPPVGHSIPAFACRDPLPFPSALLFESL